MGDLATLLSKQTLETPDQAAYAPTAMETGLAGAAVTNPYAMGHLAGAMFRGQGLRDRYVADMAASNAAIRDNAGQQFQAMYPLEVMRSIDQTKLPPGMMQELFKSLKVPMSEEVLSGVDQRAIAQQQAGAISDYGSGAKSAAEAGQGLTPSPELQAGMGVSQTTQIPTGVQIQNAKTEGDTGLVTITYIEGGLQKAVKVPINSPDGQRALQQIQQREQLAGTSQPGAPTDTNPTGFSDILPPHLQQRGQSLMQRYQETLGENLTDYRTSATNEGGLRVQVSYNDPQTGQPKSIALIYDRTGQFVGQEGQ